MKNLNFSYIKEKWSHTGFQKYLKSTGWSMSSRVLSMAVSFLATVFIARELGPTNFGQLSYAISFVAIFSFTASMGIDYILYRELIKNPDNKEKLLGSAFIIKVVAGTITAIICILFSAIFTADDVSKILIIILTGTFIFGSFQIINHDFQSRAESKYPAIITFITGIIINISKIIVIFLGKGVIYLSLVLLLESILYALFYWYIYKKKLSGKITRWKYDTTTTISLLKDSWPLIFSGAFVLIYSRIDQIFIKHMLDASSVGIYDSAVRIAEVWYFIPSIIVTALFPAIIHAKKISEESYNLRLGRLALLLFIIPVLISLPLTILAPFIMQTLYGHAFIGGTIILQIYIWASIGIFLGTLVTNYLIAENCKKILLFVSLIPMITNVLLNLLWIPSFGIVGSAYATLVSYLLIPLSILLFKETRTRIVMVYKSLI